MRCKTLEEFSKKIVTLSQSKEFIENTKIKNHEKKTEKFLFFVIDFLLVSFSILFLK